jgi:exopolyphosphatase/guanosine-5'-triphosphate,3'-diphosphate pyrophosphatase
MQCFATVDLGTNTALLLVAELSHGKLRSVFDRAEIVRLGRGVYQRGRLDPATAERVLALLAEFRDEAQRLGAQGLAAVGTASLRDASDGDAFREKARQVLGAPLELISGDEEARLAALSVARAFPSPRPRVIFDIGGGSTELVLVEGDQILGRRSYPIGSVRFTEQFIKNDPPTQDELTALQSAADACFVDLPFAAPVWSGPADLFGTAGTVTTLQAIADEVDPYDPPRIHGAVLSADSVASIVRRLSSLSLAARQQVRGLAPGRADVILAGATIFLAILRRLGAASATVSDHGLRHGLWWSRFGDLIDLPTP